MEDFVGIDVCLEASSVCLLLDSVGKIIRKTKVASEPEALASPLVDRSSNRAGKRFVSFVDDAVSGALEVHVGVEVLGGLVCGGKSDLRHVTSSPKARRRCLHWTLDLLVRIITDKLQIRVA
jgi:hypothetical protein